MKLPVFFALLLALGGVAPLAHAQDDGPRQLGAPPTVPSSAPRRATAPAPAAPVPAAPPAAALPADSAAPQAVSRPAPLPGPATGPTPVYAPTPAGQLPGGSSRPTRFQVGLKGGMVYNVYSVEQHSPIFGHSYLLLDGQRKVDFADVGFYEDESGHYVRTTLPGSSRETTFRRDRTGRISLYSTQSSSYSPGYGGGLGGFGGYGGGYGGYPGGYGGYPYGNGYRTTKTEYFSKDNGPIQNLNYRNLALATRDNAGAQELLAQGRHYQTAIAAAYIVGGGLLLAGVLQSLQSNNGQQSISPLLYAGIPILIVPIVLQGKQAASQRQAIALYNGTPGAR